MTLKLWSNKNNILATLIIFTNYKKRVKLEPDNYSVKLSFMLKSNVIQHHHTDKYYIPCSFIKS